MKGIDLHRCHNCKSKNVKVGGITVFDHVECKDCGFEGPSVWDNIQLAIDLWNLKGSFASSDAAKERAIKANKKTIKEMVTEFRNKE